MRFFKNPGKESRKLGIKSRYSRACYSNYAFIILYYGHSSQANKFSMVSSPGAVRLKLES